MAETITIRKDLFDKMLTDFDNLLDDFEVLTDQEMLEEAEKRIEEIKSGKVKALSEEEFVKLMREDGFDVQI
ncbi:addiction module protein [Candidatus Woesearchaeota archaeon]|nr:addiction module protein [Candidatus Woesearchaeota archaeon]